MSGKTLGLGFFVDPAGETVQLPQEQAAQALQLGYLPASPEQIENFQRVEKFSTFGQQAKTFGEGLAQSLTLGGSTWLQTASGLSTPEDIKAREEINPGTHFAGELTGIALPILATGGASAAVEGAAGAAEATSALRTIGEGAQAAARYTAPALYSRAGEAVAHGVGSLLPEAAGAAGRILTKGVTGASSAAVEGAFQGVGHVVHEAALGDPNLTAQSALEEVGLSALFGGAVGAGAGILGSLTREAAAGPIGKKIEEWAENFEGRQHLKQAGAIKSDISREAKKIGLKGVKELGQEGGDLGLVSAFSTPAETLERSEALMESAGRKMGDILETADTAGAAPRAFEEIADRVHADVLKEMGESPFKEATADKVKALLGKFEEKFGGRGEEVGLTFRDLHQLRREVSAELYGVRGSKIPGDNYYAQALHDFRSIISDELSQGFEKAGLEKASAEAWKTANREYQVASTFAKFAEKGIERGIGNNLVPLTSILTGLGGAVMGGPAGASALGIGGYLAKRYGPGVLGQGARSLRHLVDHGGAEALINKTAELIAKERSTGPLVRAMEVATEHLEPALEPAKDATEDVLRGSIVRKQDRRQLGGQIEAASSDAPERLAALSHLEAAQQRVIQRTNEAARAFVTGKALKSQATAVAAKTAEEFEAQMEKVRAIANNPESAAEHITRSTADLHEHAPNVAQAVAVNASRALAHLSQQFPPKPKTAPLAPPMVPSQQEIWRYNKTREALDKPAIILEHASAGTLTPMQVDAVRAAYPERLQQMQTAVLEQIAEHKGKVPYAQRLMLPILFGRDMDGTTSPEAIRANQAVYQLPSAKSGLDSTGPGVVRTTQTDLSKLKVSSQALTPGQASESRRRGVE